MAILHIDGFDHYGTDTARMTEGPYDQVDAAFTLSEVNPRTGARCLRRDTTATENIVLKSLGLPKNAIGSGLVFSPSQMPTNENSYAIMDFRDPSGIKQITMALNPDGSLDVRSGGLQGGVIISSNSAVVSEGTYNHIEMAAYAPSSFPEEIQILTFVEKFTNGLDPYDVLNPAHFEVVSTEHGNGVKITNTDELADTENDAATREIPTNFYSRITFKARVDVNALEDKSVAPDIGVLQILFQDSSSILIVLSRQFESSTGDDTRRAKIFAGVDSQFIGSNILTIGQFYDFDLNFNWSTGILDYQVTEVGGGVFGSGQLEFPTSMAFDRLVLDIDVGLGESLGDAATFADFDFYAPALTGNTDGVVEVRVGGVTVISIASAGTAGAAESLEYGSVALHFGGYGLPHGVTTDIDDWYIWDDRGAWNNSFLGDRRCLLMKPNQDTNIADFDPSSGSFGYKMIDEDSPDDDSTYIIAEAYLQSGSPLSGTSEFEIEDLPNGTSLISAVNVVTRASKTDATSAEIFTSISSGSDSLSEDAHVLTTSYQYFSDIFEFDPSTISNLTKDSFNALTVSVTADDLDPGVAFESPGDAISPPTDEAVFSPIDLFDGGEDGGWYDPSDLSTLWQDTAGTVPVTADGQSVARIDDKSGNGRHLTQSTSAARPLYKTLAGLHWLEFDGTDDDLQSAEGANITENGGVLAASASSDEAELSRGILEEVDLIGGVTRRNAIFFDTRATNNRFCTYAPDGTSRLIDLNAEISGSEKVFIMSSDGSLARGYLDNVEQGSSVSSTANFANNTRISLGKQTNGNFFLNGKIYGAVVLDRAVTEQERSDLNDYLAEKAGIV